MNFFGESVYVFIFLVTLLFFNVTNSAQAAVNDPSLYTISSYDYFGELGGLKFANGIPGITHLSTISIESGKESSMDIFVPAEVFGPLAEMYYLDGGERQFEHRFFEDYVGLPPYTWIKGGQYEVDIFGTLGTTTTSVLLTTMEFTIIINGEPEPTCSLSVEPDTVSPKEGESVLLTWSSTDATSVTFDQGIGAVATSGSFQVSPNATTTYTATFIGSGGTAVCAVVVNVPDPVVVPLYEKAAMLAKQLVSHPDAYLWGGKGWDYDLREFTAPERILSGYTYYNPDTSSKQTGVGVDCSGLITWAFNRVNDAAAGFNSNYIKYVNADGMFRDYQSDSVAESDIRPGDTLSFDWNGDGRMDHVAMYVGESGGYDVVNARSRDFGIEEQSVDIYSSLDAFTGFRRIHQADVEMIIKTGSPVDVEVIDPDGNILGSTTTIASDEEYIREVPGELYYLEYEKGHDGRPQDFIIAPRVKEGTYVITVIPEENADPTATYSLSVEINGVETVVVDNEPIDTTPENGFSLKIADGDIKSIDPTIKVLLEDLYQTYTNFSISSASRHKNLLSTIESALVWFGRDRIDQVTRKITKVQNDSEKHIADELTVGELGGAIQQINDLLQLLGV